MDQKTILVAIAIQLERIADLMAEDMKNRGMTEEVEEVNEKAKETTKEYLYKFY